LLSRSISRQNFHTNHTPPSAGFFIALIWSTQTGELGGWKTTQMGDVNPIDFRDGEEVQELSPSKPP